MLRDGREEARSLIRKLDADAIATGLLSRSDRKPFKLTIKNYELTLKKAELKERQFFTEVSLAIKKIEIYGWD